MHRERERCWQGDGGRAMEGGAWPGRCHGATCPVTLSDLASPCSRHTPNVRHIVLLALIIPPWGLSRVHFSSASPSPTWRVTFTTISCSFRTISQVLFKRDRQRARLPKTVSLTHGLISLLLSLQNVNSSGRYANSVAMGCHGAEAHLDPSPLSLGTSTT